MLRMLALIRYTGDKLLAIAARNQVEERGA